MKGSNTTRFLFLLCALLRFEGGDSSLISYAALAPHKQFGNFDFNLVRHPIAELNQLHYRALWVEAEFKGVKQNGET